MGAVPWKWWYDVAAGAMCFVAVPVALAPVMTWGRRVSLRLVFVLACIGTGLLVLRFAASMAQTAYLLAVSRFRLSMVGRWEPWFWIGTILFVVSTWQSRRTALGRPMPTETSFRKLNENWNAEPNAPEPVVRVEQPDLILEFGLNPWQFPQFADGQ